VADDDGVVSHQDFFDQQAHDMLPLVDIGQMPSGLFGANGAWWAVMILAHNLNAAMKRLVLGPAWVARRMKALRFHLINLPGA
jgi:hypothetical protein